MRRLAIFILTLAAVLSASAQQQDTVYVSEFGVTPYSYENSEAGIRAALRACKERQARVLVFDKGRYDVWPEGAERREWFISNTSTETECPSKVKTVGILIEDMHDLTVEGNDASLVFHGKMITIAVAHSRNIVLKGLHIDFERPGMSEMTVIDHDSTGTTVQFHRDSRYEVDADGHIRLYGEGWRSKVFHCLDYTPATEHLHYSRAWDWLRSSRARDLGGGRVHFATPEEFATAPGQIFSVRDVIRDHVGLFLFESRDVELRDMHVHYMHGLGIVSQYTHNITMQSVECAPREGSGRLIASSADFMHFSGCSGRVRILDCRFSGAQDDPVNVHGTNLRIVRRTASDRAVLRFMHGQSYGFRAFSEQDTVAFVCAATMERHSYAVVKSVKPLSEREVEVTFDRKIPKELKVNSDCVENITCTPEVEIRRCRFTHTNTRGTLMTTPRRVVIADNVYIKTGMSAILIEGDAEGWYESGPVCDVTIENNTFIDCGYVGGPANAVIALHPSNTIIDAERPVHRNVRILNNRFVTFGNPVLYAKSTSGLRFEGNEVSVEFEDDRRKPEREPKAADLADAVFTFKPFVLLGCKDVSIANNHITGYDNN